MEIVIKKPEEIELKNDFLKATRLLEDALLLVEQNFYFLHAAQFFGKLAKEAKFDDSLLDVTLVCDKSRTYRFHPQFTKAVLEDSKAHSEVVSFFEYFSAFNAFRGVGMAMVEAMRLELEFTDFLQNQLDKQYESFYDLLCFVRNVLSHNIHAEIALSSRDFQGTLKRMRRMKREPIIDFSFIYSRDLPQIASPYPDYGFECNIDFGKLEEGMEFLEILPLWELCMISELSFNLVQAFRGNIANNQELL